MWPSIDSTSWSFMEPGVEVGLTPNFMKGIHIFPLLIVGSFFNFGFVAHHCSVDVFPLSLLWAFVVCMGERDMESGSDNNSRVVKGRQ